MAKYTGKKNMKKKSRQVRNTLNHHNCLLTTTCVCVCLHSGRDNQGCQGRPVSEHVFKRGRIDVAYRASPTEVRMIRYTVCVLQHFGINVVTCLRCTGALAFSPSVKLTKDCQPNCFLSAHILTYSHTICSGHSLLKERVKELLVVLKCSLPSISLP